MQQTVNNDTTIFNLSELTSVSNSDILKVLSTEGLIEVRGTRPQLASFIQPLGPDPIKGITFIVLPGEIVYTPEMAQEDTKSLPSMCPYHMADFDGDEGNIWMSDR